MRVSAERCAHLISVTIANRLDEVWISKNPILLFVYLNQYAPNFTRWSVTVPYYDFPIERKCVCITLTFLG